MKENGKGNDNNYTNTTVELSARQFPSRLREIPDAPKKLYLRGKLPTDDMKYLCVVGARKYSEYGRHVCEKMIEGLRGLPIVIVSGLALGIDSVAHTTALETSLVTIAIPGSGLNNEVLYPASNRHLAGRILKSGGAILSEFEPSFKATPWSFPQRNSIMAGISDAVLVVEAEQKSGTLITSRLATEYNRDVLTVPGSIFSINSAGPHMLLKLGAALVTNSSDIISVLGIDKLPGMQKTANPTRDCSEDEKIILEALKEPMTKDDLIRTLKIPVSKFNATLSILEIKDLIRETMGMVNRNF